MKFEFIDLNTQFKYEFEFYHYSYFEYYLLYTIHMESASSMSSAFKIINKKIVWNTKYDPFFSLEAKEFCNQTMERINKNIAFI